MPSTPWHPLRTTPEVAAIHYAYEDVDPWVLLASLLGKLERHGVLWPEDWIRSKHLATRPKD